MERQTAEMVRWGVLSVGISLILYRLTSSVILLTVPLLFVAPRFHPAKWALAPVGAVAVLLVGSQMVGVGGYSDDAPATAGVMMVGMYLPVSMLFGAGVWIGLAGRRMLKRLIIGSIPAAVGGFGLVLWFSGGSGSATATADVFRQMVETLVSSLLGSQPPVGMDAKAIFDLVVVVVKQAFLPIFMGQFGLSVMVSELLINRSDRFFQERMIHWRLPVNAVWVFLGGWAMVLATMLVDMPVLDSVAWNAALAVSLLYMVQGMSIAANYVLRKKPDATAAKIFVLLLVLAMLPGVNVILLVALPLLGVSETWIGYRKNT